MEIISRSVARGLGLKLFFTGVPCKKSGHLASRYVSDGGCVECNKERTLKRKQKDIEKYRESCRRACQKWSKSKEKEYRQQRKLIKPDEGALKAKAYRQRHPEKVKESAQKTRDRYRERYRNLTKDYWKRNPSVRQANRAAYYGRKRGAEGSFSSNDIKKIEQQQGMKCNGCGCDLQVTGYQIDHVIPLSLGGSNYSWNLQLLCAPCNQRKGNRLPAK